MDTVTVCLTVDFDAVSPWLHGDPDDDTPTNRSRGVFGAEVGAPRLLDLFDRHDLPTTWFVPGHTVESFPDACERVVAEGHSVQHHGWSHRPPADYGSRVDERADLERGVAAIEALTGETPTGYRSPAWDFSEHTLSLLVDLGFDWDSSMMARDFELYRPSRDVVREDGTYARDEPAAIVELPVSWQRDDFPPLAFVGDRGFVDEAAVFRSWREQFDWAYDCGGVFVLTMHPQVIDRPDRLAKLGEFVDHAQETGAEFRTVRAVAEAFG